MEFSDSAVSKPVDHLSDDGSMSGVEETPRRKIDRGIIDRLATNSQFIFVLCSLFHPLTESP
jgi:hypothetical protein